MPNAFLEEEGKLVRDRISDDQALFIELTGKRLVVITGCAHALAQPSPSEGWQALLSTYRQISKIRGNPLAAFSRAID